MAIQTRNLTTEQLDYLLASVEVMSYGDEIVLVIGHLPNCMDNDAGGIVDVLFQDGSTEELTYDAIKEDNSIFYVTKPIYLENIDNWADTKGEIPDLFKKLGGYPVVNPN